MDIPNVPHPNHPRQTRQQRLQMEVIDGFWKCITLCTLFVHRSLPSPMQDNKYKSFRPFKTPIIVGPSQAADRQFISSITPALSFSFSKQRYRLSVQNYIHNWSFPAGPPQICNSFHVSNYHKMFNFPSMVKKETPTIHDRITIPTVQLNVNASLKRLLVMWIILYLDFFEDPFNGSTTMVPQNFRKPSSSKLSSHLHGFGREILTHPAFGSIRMFIIKIDTLIVSLI